MCFGVLALGWLLGMQRLARVLAANRREGRPHAGTPGLRLAP